MRWYMYNGLDLLLKVREQIVAINRFQEMQSKAE